MAAVDTSNSPTPADSAAAVTPHDTNELTAVTRGIYVGGDGNLAVVTKGGQTVTFTGVVAGSVIPVRAKKVLATGTTATNIVALW